jgi:hypothetical protein
MCAVALLTTRARFFHDPPEADIGTYAVIANELNHGQRLYADSWDVKPPGVFATYAATQRLFGYGQMSLYVMSVTTALMTLVGLWLIGRQVNEASATWASVFWTAMCFDPNLGANLPNCECFMNAALTLGWACLLVERPARPLLFCIAAMLFAVASFYKQVALTPAICVAVAIALTTKRGPVRSACAFVAIILICWTALFGYFALTNRNELLWTTLVTYPRFYSGNSLVNILASVNPQKWFRPSLMSLWPALALCLVTCIALGRDPALRRILVLLVAMLVGSWIAVAAPGKWLDHYFQLLMPPLCVGGGIAAARLWSSRFHFRALAGLAVLATFWPQVHWLTLDPATRVKLKYRDEYVAVREDFLDVERTLSRDQSIYIWGEEPWLYMITQRRCPYAAVWRSHAISGPMADYLTQRTLEQLHQNPPAIIASFGGVWPEDHPIVRWISAHYEPIPGTNPYPLQMMRRLPARN